MTEHTPGPWKVHCNTAHYGSYRLVNDIGGATTIERVATDLANTRLIAAAPDLLEACNWAYCELEERDFSREDVLEVLAKAIRKAN